MTRFGCPSPSVVQSAWTEESCAWIESAITRPSCMTSAYTFLPCPIHADMRKGEATGIPTSMIAIVSFLAIVIEIANQGAVGCSVFSGRRRGGQNVLGKDCFRSIFGCEGTE